MLEVKILIELAAFYKALSDENRLKIIQMLIGKELCVCEIFENLDLSQPTISHHLKILKYAGLIKDKKEGKWVFYTLNTEQLKEKYNLSKSVFEEIIKTGKIELQSSPVRNDVKCK